MKTVLRGYLTVSAAIAMCFLTVASASAQSQTNKLRVGVYDSRAIAVAYAGSPAFQESLKSIRTEYEKAKQDNNEKRMKEIDAKMKLNQRRMHEQGFSTGSVASIMAHVKDSLPNVAKKAGVQVIVSKWELNYSSEVEIVDVTDDIVALFQPNEKALKNVKELSKHAPVPIEDITDDTN